MLDKTQILDPGPEPDVRVVGFDAWCNWHLADIRFKKATGWYDRAPYSRSQPLSIDGDSREHDSGTYLNHNNPDSEGAGL